MSHFTLVHVAGILGITTISALLTILTWQMQSLGPFFTKVGALSLILVWVFLVGPFFSFVAVVSVFKARAQLTQLGCFGFVILGLFILMAFVNENTNRFRKESKARSAAVSLKSSLKEEAVRVKNILLPREIYDSYARLEREQRNHEPLKHIMTVYAENLTTKQERKLITFYVRDEFDLRRISEEDEEKLNSAKELMLVEDCHEKYRLRELYKN